MDGPSQPTSKGNGDVDGSSRLPLLTNLPEPPQLAEVVLSVDMINGTPVMSQDALR